MSHSPPKQLCFPPVAGQTIRADFEGGALSSDFGALLLRGVDRQIGLTARLAAAIRDKRHQSYIDHPLRDLLAQRIYQIASGYADANDANPHGGACPYTRGRLPALSASIGTRAPPLYAAPACPARRGALRAPPLARLPALAPCHAQRTGRLTATVRGLGRAAQLAHGCPPACGCRGVGRPCGVCSATRCLPSPHPAGLALMIVRSARAESLAPSWWLSSSLGRSSSSRSARPRPWQPGCRSTRCRSHGPQPGPGLRPRRSSGGAGGPAGGRSFALTLSPPRGTHALTLGERQQRNHNLRSGCYEERTRGETYSGLQASEISRVLRYCRF